MKMEINIKDYMSDEEIKEILNNQKLINVENDYERIIFEYLANNCSEFDDEHIKQLVNLKVEQYKQSLDYITNLQEENKEIKNTIDFIDNKYKNTINYNEKLIEYNQDYKSRIDRAVKYIERCRDYHKTYHSEERIFPDEITSLLMVLNGGDDNE